MSEQSAAAGELVFKIVDAPSWKAAMASGVFLGSAEDLRDGFIHLSTAAQLEGTARKHFAGRGDLLLVAYAARDLGPDLRWEVSRGGALFPHLYVGLPTLAARWTEPLALGSGDAPDVAAALARHGSL